jgi:hypothetical protein
MFWAHIKDGSEKRLLFKARVVVWYQPICMAVFCWQCLRSRPVLLHYLHCLCQCRQVGWHRMVPFVGLGLSVHLPYYDVCHDQQLY